jgi:hypothetical protein
MLPAGDLFHRPVSTTTAQNAIHVAKTPSKTPACQVIASPAKAARRGRSFSLPNGQHFIADLLRVQRPVLRCTIAKNRGFEECEAVNGQLVPSPDNSISVVGHALQPDAGILQSLKLVC